jgi:carotenoid cleavage dioxygenase-like enzyme
MELITKFGAVPKEISGMMLKNSAKPFKGINYNHPFDGHGYINKFRFDNGKIHYSGLRIETDEYKIESKAKKQTFRSLGTNRENETMLNLNLNNFSNLNVFKNRNKVYSLYEGGLPYEIDPVSETTIKKENFGHPLLSNLGYVPSTVHPKTHNEITYNCISFTIGLSIYSDEKFITTTLFPFGKSYYFHDFWVTDKYFAIYLTPVEIDIFNSIVVPNKTIMESIKFKKRAKIILIDKQHLKDTWYDVPIEFDYPALHIAHFDDRHLDVCLIKTELNMAKIKNAHSYEHSFLTRFTLDENVSAKQLSATPCDMPVKFNHSKVVLINEYDIIIYDTETLHVIKRYINCIKLEEPTVVNNKYITLIAHNKNITHLYVLDEHLEILSISDLYENISYGFHGTFINSA